MVSLSGMLDVAIIRKKVISLYNKHENLVVSSRTKKYNISLQSNLKFGASSMTLK